MMEQTCATCTHWDEVFPGAGMCGAISGGTRASDWCLSFGDKDKPIPAELSVEDGA